ncbi:MAG: GNAT family N-acetyltransferase [SAR202 cluster bacterium]|nr:GNAT family N-acetyltransferase [SAR202 cluster bacterium]
MTPQVRLEDFHLVQAEWTKLLPSCITDTIFLTPWVQTMWVNHFGKAPELRVFSVREGDRLVGLAPMMVRDGVLSFLGGKDLFDYHDFLVPHGNEDAFYPALFAHLKTLEWTTMDLRSVLQSSPTAERMKSLAEAAGYSTELKEEDKAPFMPLPATFDDYVAALPKKDRHELRRKQRRLAEAAPDRKEYTCTTPDEVAGLMPDFFRLHKASSPNKNRFMNPAREQYFLEMAKDLASRGQFRLSVMEIGGKRVAACINFDYGDSYLLYNSGYDTEYANLSVGLLNTALTIKEAIENGKKTFDFLRGTERYKYDLGAQDKSVYQLVVRR